ncbi:MAG: hypothetical protein JWO60_1092, partial [Frankiales bacterium]|nr:hypothetical protein [Frankiales bacterium]
GDGFEGIEQRIAPLVELGRATLADQREVGVARALHR